MPASRRPANPPDPPPEPPAGAAALAAAWVDAMPGPAIVIDAAGKLIAANPEGRVWYGGIPRRQWRRRSSPSGVRLRALEGTPGWRLGTSGWGAGAVPDELRWRLMVEIGYDVMVWLDAQGRRILVSPNYEQLSGSSPADRLGQPVWEGVHPDDRERAKRLFRRILKRPGATERTEMRLSTASGWHWCEVLVTNRLDDPRIGAVVVNSRDIHARKLAEEARRVGEERLALSLAAANLGCWEWNLAEQTIDFDDRYAAQLGYSRAELNDPLLQWESIHPEDRERVLRTNLDLLESGAEPIDVGLRVIRRDGAVRWVRNIGRVVGRDAQGRPLRALGVRMDVTRDVEAERALQASEQRYRVLADHATDAIFRLAPDGTIRFATPSAEDILGLGPEELTGQDLLRFVVPEHRRRVVDVLCRLAPEERLGGLLFRVEGARRSVWLEATACGIAGADGGSEVVVIARDTEERLRAEDQLRRRESRWRSMMDNLPSGIALIHEDQVLFNRTVAQITGYQPGEVRTLGEWFARAFDEPYMAEAAYRTAFQSSEPHPIRAWIRRKDGDYRYVEFAGYRDEEGEVWVLHDLTEINRAENRLRAQNDLLNAVSRVQAIYLDTDQPEPLHEAILREAAALTGGRRLWLAEVDASRGEPVVGPLRSRWTGWSEADGFRWGWEDDAPPIQLRLAGGRWWIEAGHDVLWQLMERGGRPVAVLGVQTTPTENPLGRRLELFFDTVAHVLQTTQGDRTRRVLETASRIQAQVVSQVQEAVATYDLEGRITSWNNGARRLFGYPEAEAVGLPVASLFPPGLPTDVPREADFALSRSPHYTLETSMVTRSREVFFARLQVTNLRSDEGEVVGRILYASDVTERRKAELRVRTLNQQLEERVRRRTGQLETAVRELEAFTYTVSHDLRTPLRAISGYANLLAESAAERLDVDDRDLLNHIDRNAVRMGRLIDDLLRLSRLGRQSLELAPVSLRDVVEDVLGQLAHERAERDVSVLHADLPTVRGDAALLRVVFANLLGNALKFTRGQPKAVVEIRASVENGVTSVGVIDNGAGFDMRYSGKLFTVFQRLHSEREFEGTGVGLAIVKRIVERHGGRVWATSAPGEGAAFWFTLPPPSEPAGLAPSPAGLGNLPL